MNTAKWLLQGVERATQSSKAKPSQRVSICAGLLLAVGISAGAQEAVAIANTSPAAFTAFEAPGAGTGPMQGTVATCINTAGEIAGFIIDAKGVMHGFVRAVNGAFTTFDVVPAAGTAKGQGTVAFGINDSGDVAGTYADANNGYHGFVRAANGSITTFDAPDGQTSWAHLGTAAFGINPAGTIAGVYMDTNYMYHGFTRTAAGTFATIDVPGEDTASNGGLGTHPLTINAAGTIAGLYASYGPSPCGSWFNSGGFVSVYDGATTTFSIPGSARSCNGFYFLNFILSDATIAFSINDAGDIAGTYPIAKGLNRGFVRAANGTISTFAAPGAAGGTGVFEGTFGTSINSDGAVAGAFSDADGVMHGLLRAINGTITTFDAPGAGTTGLISGTTALGINKVGTIAGTYSDADSVFHGFAFHTASMVATTCTLAAAQTSSVYRKPATFTATVASAGGAPPNGETVWFMDGQTQLGTAKLDEGKASLTTTDLPVGADSITAAYGGNLSYNGSASRALRLMVGKAKSFTRLAAAPNPAALNESVTLTATVTGQFGGMTTGTVKFFYGYLTHPLITELGTASLSKGRAEFITAKLPRGAGMITAEYSGNANLLESTSEPLSMVVGESATMVELTASVNPSNAGQSVTFTATVTAKSGGTPAGTVTFKDGATVLKTVLLSEGVARSASATLTAGTHHITAVYGGSADFIGSSGALTQTVK